MAEKSKSYFSGVIYEAKKVDWPKGKKLNKMVLTVVVFCAIFAVIFLCMDFIINVVFRWLGV